MPEIQQIIDALGCFKTSQHDCKACPFNPEPGMMWPYGCIKGQAEIVNAARDALRKAADVVRCKDCTYCRLLNDGVSFECVVQEIDFYAPYYDAATYYCAEGKRRDA